ncbi:MAG: hypothetical protein JWP10_1241 [Nocardioidaceae bacterium]|nr:hypothetical protein [Nocardioidaceae bacterium]
MFLVKLHPVESTALESAGYDPVTRLLTVRFLLGGTYEYVDVAASLYEDLLAAQPHPWTAVGPRVKTHRYRQID